MSMLYKEAFHASWRINTRTCLCYIFSRVSSVRFGSRLIAKGLTQFQSWLLTKIHGLPLLPSHIQKGITMKSIELWSERHLHLDMCISSALNASLPIWLIQALSSTIPQLGHLMKAHYWWKKALASFSLKEWLVTAWQSEETQAIAFLCWIPSQSVLPGWGQAISSWWLFPSPGMSCCQGSVVRRERETL